MEDEEAVEALEQYLAGQVNATDSSRRLTELLGERDKARTLRMASGTVEDRRPAQAQQLVRVAELGVVAGAKGALVVVDELDHDVLNDHDGRVSAMLGSLARPAGAAPWCSCCSREMRKRSKRSRRRGPQVLVLQDLSDADVEKLVHKRSTHSRRRFPRRCSRAVGTSSSAS